MNRFVKASLLAAAFGMAVTSAFAENETFGGIGIAIYQLRDGVKVAEVIPGTPAAETKLQAGDVIVSVDGESLAGKNIEESKELLRGIVNKPLEITFVSAGDTLSSVVRRTQLTVTDIESEKVEAWYDKSEFNAQELETYASATVSDKQLVAVLKNGIKIADKFVNASGLNGIYVERADEFAPKAKTQPAKVGGATLKGLSRKSVGFDLKAAGTAKVSIMNADGEVVAALRLDNARPGYNTMSWDGEFVPSGRYMVTIEHNGTVSGKAVMLK